MAVTNQIPVLHQTYGHLLRLKTGLLDSSEVKDLAQEKIQHLSPAHQATLLQVLKWGFSTTENLIALNQEFEKSEGLISWFLQIFSPSKRTSEFPEICASALVKFHPCPPLPNKFDNIPDDIRAIIGERLSQVDTCSFDLFLEKVQLVSPNVPLDLKFEFCIKKINFSRIPLRDILPLDLSDTDYLSTIVNRTVCHLTHVDVSGIPISFFRILFEQASKIKSLVLKPLDFEEFPLKDKIEELTLQDGELSSLGWHDRGLGKAGTIFEYTRLQRLEFNRITFSDDSINTIFSSNKLTNIRVLSLNALRARKMLSSLSNLSSLTHLQISQCPSILPKLPSILSNHPCLQVLDLSNNRAGTLKDVKVIKLFKGCSALEFIQFPKAKVTREEINNRISSK